MKEDLKNEVVNFLKSFEEVFHNDWNYSKNMMGIQPETEEQKRNAKILGLETIYVIAENGTFIDPKVKDEIEDWGNRGELLKNYRELKRKLNL